MDRECVICGSIDDIEKHHPAGRKFVPQYTVDVCSMCHRVLTLFQRSIGIPLDKGPRSDVDRVRASLVGTMHVFHRMQQQSPDAVVATKFQVGMVVGFAVVAALPDDGSDYAPIGLFDSSAVRILCRIATVALFASACQAGSRSEDIGVVGNVDFLLTVRQLSWHLEDTSDEASPWTPNPRISLPLRNESS